METNLSAQQLGKLDIDREDNLFSVFKSQWGGVVGRMWQKNKNQKHGKVSKLDMPVCCKDKKNKF